MRRSPTRRWQKQVIMLVFTRKVQESIVIRDGVVITVTKVQGDKVRLGIEAPNEVGVHRKEVYEKVARSGEPATRNRGDIKLVDKLQNHDG